MTPAISTALEKTPSAESGLQPAPPASGASRAANDMFRSTARVLSAPGAEWEAPEDVRDKLCFTDDGILRVDPAHRGDPHLLSYTAKLRRNRIDFKEVDAQFSEIKALYQGDTDKVVVELLEKTTQRQEEVLSMVREAAGLRASDIHIVTDKESATVRYRIHGILQDRYQLSRQRGEDMISAIYNSMCDQAERNREPSRDQNGRFKESFAKRCGLHVARVATGPTDDGTHTVIRLYTDTATDDEMPTLQARGYLPEQIADIEIMMRRKSGMVLISGATGSGKTTTLATILRRRLLETEGRISIITGEDPPEQPIKVKAIIDGKPCVLSAQQKPVRPNDPSEEEVTAAWVRLIDHMLRCDPDVMMLGELRSLASMQAAIRGCLSGHLTFTTIHAKDAPTTLERLWHNGVDIGLLTDPGLFIGLINQTLVSVSCPHCSRPFSGAKHQLPAGLAQRVQTYCTPDTVRVASEQGCEHCFGGVVGRTVCAEVIRPTKGFMDTYRNHGKNEARRYWIEHMGGITLCQHMIRLVNSGRVCPRLAEEILPLDNDVLEMEG